VFTERERQLDESNSPVSVESSPSGGRVLQRLISGTFPQDELASLIEKIFSSRQTIDLVDCLQESDVQAFIDVIHEVCCRSFILANGPSSGFVDP